MNRPLRLAVASLFVLLIIAGPVGGWFYLAFWNWPQHPGDQVSLVGVVAGVVTVYLAALAAVVALLAFLFATRVPELEVKLIEKPDELGFPFKDNWSERQLAEGFDLWLGKPDHELFSIAGPPALIFRLKNTRNFTARNPAVRLKATNLLLSSNSRPGWTVEVRSSPSDQYDLYAYWQGGANASIHGHMPLDIDLSLADGSSLSAPPVTLSIEVFAEGFHLKPQDIPVRIHARVPESPT